MRFCKGWCNRGLCLWRFGRIIYEVFDEGVDSLAADVFLDVREWEMCVGVSAAGG